MSWTTYKLGLKTFDAPIGNAAQEISANFQRIADLLEAADNAGVDVSALAAQVAALSTSVSRLQQFVHVQSVPLATWTINHNLGRYPTVTVIDSFNDNVEGGAINYPSVNSLTVTFAGAFSGRAVLT